MQPICKQRIGEHAYTTIDLLVETVVMKKRIGAASSVKFCKGGSKGMTIQFSCLLKASM
jgi:hypothetical protein